MSLTLSIPLNQVSLSCLDSDRKKCNRTQPCSSSKSSQPDTSFVVSQPLPPEKQQITSISPDSPGLNSAVVSKPHQQQSFTTITDFHSTVIAGTSLPDGWIDLTRGSEEMVTLSKLQHYPGKPVESSHTLQINPDFTRNVHVHGHLVLRSQCSLLSDIPEKLQCKED